MRDVIDVDLLDGTLLDCEKYLCRLSMGDLRALLCECDSGHESSRAQPVRWAQFRILVASEITRAAQPDTSSEPRPDPPRSLRLVPRPRGPDAT